MEDVYILVGITIFLFLDISIRSVVRMYFYVSLVNYESKIISIRPKSGSSTYSWANLHRIALRKLLDLSTDVEMFVNKYTMYGGYIGSFKNEMNGKDRMKELESLIISEIRRCEEVIHCKVYN